MSSLDRLQFFFIYNPYTVGTLKNEQISVKSPQFANRGMELAHPHCVVNFFASNTAAASLAMTQAESFNSEATWVVFYHQFNYQFNYRPKDAKERKKNDV